MSESENLDRLLALEKKANELAKIILVTKGTDNDVLSDFGKDEIGYLSILSAIQSKIDSMFIKSLIDSLVLFRKSSNRKSRKELVEMFKSLREEEKSRDEKFRDLLGLS